MAAKPESARKSEILCRIDIQHLCGANWSKKNHISTSLFIEVEYKYYVQWEFLITLLYHIHCIFISLEVFSIVHWTNFFLLISLTFLIHQLDQPVIEIEPTYHIDITSINKEMVTRGAHQEISPYLWFQVIVENFLRINK